jgi:hypothetical protein
MTKNNKFRDMLLFLGIGVMAMLIFLWLRWEPEPWLRSQLDANGLSRSVQFASASKSKLGLRIQGVRISSQAGVVSLKEVMIYPAWRGMLSGKPAVRVLCRLDAGGEISAVLSVRENVFQASEIQSSIPASVVQSFSPVTLGGLLGSVQSSGAFSYHLVKGRPLMVNVQLAWRGAGLDFINQGKPLGDYVFLLSGDEKRLEWSMEGGEELGINGRGSVAPTAGAIQGWRLDGGVEVHPGKSLEPVFRAFGLPEDGRVNVSGTVMRPRIAW